jgi:hypothetical protein
MLDRTIRMEVLPSLLNHIYLHNAYWIPNTCFVRGLTVTCVTRHAS